MTVDATEKYGNFIKEAFIDPIRSVLVIDDEYPTIEKILEQQINETERTQYKDPQDILRVIQGFRDANPALIVDIHDGSKDQNDQLANHLHQSDLLILDYNLYSDDGDRSIEIASNVLKNNHFNLIVVHSLEKPRVTFEKNLLAFITKIDLSEIEQKSIDLGVEVVENCENTHPDIAKRIKSTIGFEQYIMFRSITSKQADSIVVQGLDPVRDFSTLLDSIMVSKLDRMEVFHWAIREYEKTVEKQFCKLAPDVSIDWSKDLNGPLWLRTDSGFITFIEKSTEFRLLDVLQKSIESWKPSPSRLLSAKLRSVIDDKGVKVEDQVLANRHIYAKFYQDLYSELQEEAIRVKIDAQIGRKIGDIANLVTNDVAEYFHNIVSSDREASIDSSYQSFYGLDLSKREIKQEAIKRTNAYRSCYPLVGGWHLSLGHILEIKGERWVCLSPACDLVPGQKQSGVYSDAGSGKPFLAVKLHLYSKGLDPRRINSNNYLFIPSKSDTSVIEQYSFYSKDTSKDPDDVSSPHWCLYFSSNKGIFSGEGVKKLKISKLREKQPHWSDGGVLSYEAETFECEVVAQLRYEYALNLMHKYGGDLTRIGLDFISS